MRKLNDFECSNIDFLEACGLRHAEVCLTTNIIKHAIFDATSSVKKVLKEGGVHDFSPQMPGVENKVVVESHLLTFLCDIPGTTSLYRAGGRGDARMWFGSEIYPLCQPDDIYSIFVLDTELYAINISSIDLRKCVSSAIDNPMKSIVGRVKK